MLRRKITYKPLAFLIAVLFLPTVLPAQSTRVRGRVTDAADGTPDAVRERRLSRHHDGHHHRRGGHLHARNPRHGEPRAGLDGRLRLADQAAHTGRLQPDRLRPRSRGVRYRQRRHHPRRQPGASDPAGRHPPQAPERSRPVRQLHLRHLHQDAARPDEYQAPVPQQAPATQFRVRLRLHRHLGTHRTGLPAGP